MENPPKKFFRLSPGQEVRLKHAYIIKCEAVIKDKQGKIIEIHCSYDPETKSGGAASTKKVKGTLHWVSKAHAVEAEIRLYDYLINENGAFSDPDDPEPEEELDLLDQVNEDSLVVLKGCQVEPSLADATPGRQYQFLRQGYFCADRKDHRPNRLVFNRIVGLRDSWAKVNK